MKLPTALTCLFILFSLNLVFGKDSALSKHEFNFYINDVQKSAAGAEISIIASGNTIKGNKIGGFYCFPILDTANTFDIEIKVNEIIFLGQGYKAWMLNRGTRIILGRITKLNKLMSVAEYNGMTNNDKGWESYSKRFFVINHEYTLDINNRDNIKELQFLIINPDNSHSLVTAQKIVK